MCSPPDLCNSSRAPCHVRHVTEIMQTKQFHGVQKQISATAFRQAKCFATAHAMERQALRGVPPNRRDPTAFGGGSGGDENRQTSRSSFPELSRDFLRRETHLHFAAELILFAVLAGISAWSIPLTLSAMSQSLR